MSEPSSQETYYGWKIVGAIFVVLTFTSGLSFYNHAVYLNALAEHPSFTVQTASYAVSLFFLSGGFAGLWVAKFIQAFDIRLCITGGAVISCVALTLLGYVQTIWQLYLVYMFFGVGFSASSLVPATTLVTKWFHKKRAIALSVASTGLSLGGVIITPLCAVLVESLGLTRAAPLMGSLYLIGVIPVTWLWLRPSPESMGLNVDGITVENQLDLDPEVETESRLTQSTQRSSVDSASSSQPGEYLNQGVTFRDARKSRFFWGLSFSYIFLMMAQVGGIAHQYGLAREILTETQTAMVVAILPVASIVGRLFGGWVVGHMSIRKFALVMMVVQVFSLSVLSAGFGAVSLCLGLALFGLTVGNILMLQPLLIAEAFGVKDYARIFSVCNLMSSWGTACGPAVLGLAYGLNQNQYFVPYAIIAVAGLFGLLLFSAGGKIPRG